MNKNNIYICSLFYVVGKNPDDVGMVQADLRVDLLVYILLVLLVVIGELDSTLDAAAEVVREGLGQRAFVHTSAPTTPDLFPDLDTILLAQLIEGAIETFKIFHSLC